MELLSRTIDNYDSLIFVAIITVFLIIFIFLIYSNKSIKKKLKKLNVESLADKHYREKIELSIKSANIGTWTVYYSNKIEGIKFNDNFETMLGYEKGELLKKYNLNNYRELFHPEDIQSAHIEMNKACNKEIPFFESEFRLKRPDDKWIWILSIGQIVPNLTSDKMVVVSGINIDIDHHKKLELELSQSRKMEAIGLLAGGVAHDFNNQIMGILGSVTILLERIDDPVSEKYVNLIRRSALYSADLTKKLLSYSRKGTIKKTLFDIHKAINDVQAILEHSLDKKIELSVKLNAKKSIIKGDLSQVYNCILNIAINARDAIKSRGQILIESSDYLANSDSVVLKPGQYIRIIILDSGCGMDSDTAERIFEPFFTTKPPGEGTGMGLSAAYGIVQSHGGTIELSTEKGDGSCFSLYFPVCDRVIEEIPTAERMEKEIELVMDLSILIVDDEDINREILYDFFSAKGHKVISFSNGKDALTFWKNCHKDKRPDVAILDLIMSDIDGADLFKKLKAIDQRVKGIMLSGFDNKNMEQKVLESGIDKYISKPISFEEITEAINSVIKRD